MIKIKKKKTIITIIASVVIVLTIGFLIFNRSNKPEKLISKNIESLIKKDAKSYNSTMDSRKQENPEKFGEAVKDIKITSIKEIAKEDFKQYGFDALTRQKGLSEENTKIFIVDKDVEYYEHIQTSRDSGKAQGYYILTKKNNRWIIHEWWDF